MEPAAPRPIAYLNHAGHPMANGTTVQVATGAILELAVPFARLDLNPGDPIRFYVELLRGRLEPGPGAPRGDLRADGAVAGFRADHVASLKRGGAGPCPSCEKTRSSAGG